MVNEHVLIFNFASNGDIYIKHLFIFTHQLTNIPKVSCLMPVRRRKVGDLL